MMFGFEGATASAPIEPTGCYHKSDSEQNELSVARQALPGKRLKVDEGAIEEWKNDEREFMPLGQPAI